MDVNLQHLDFGRGVPVKIESYQQHMSLDDDITSLVSIISAPHYITRHSVKRMD